MRKVMVAMSGGVDSAVAALLSRRAGYAVAGATMRLSEGRDGESALARLSADMLGIPHEEVDLSGEFNNEVIRYFVEAYERGETPNPCVRCNKKIKFGRFAAFAGERGYDYIATGHYARVVYDQATGRYLLKKGADEDKDQSYMLYALSQEQLAKAIFPLGELSKFQVRDLAAKENLPSAGSEESQDICFVPGGDYAGFIEDYRGYKSPPGCFLSASGETLGRHNGIIRYTVGQRRGLGIAAETPLYVAGKSVSDNAVMLTNESGLYKKRITLREVNLISCDDIPVSREVYVRIRYRQKAQRALVRTRGGVAEVEFFEPQKASAPGQSAVFYDGDMVIGGGVISGGV